MKCIPEQSLVNRIIGKNMSENILKLFLYIFYSALFFSRYFPRVFVTSSYIPFVLFQPTSIFIFLIPTSGTSASIPGKIFTFRIFLTFLLAVKSTQNICKFILLSGFLNCFSFVLCIIIETWF